MQHPHAEILRAIADGKEVEYHYADDNSFWYAFNNKWNLMNDRSITFRVKPEVKTGWIVIMEVHHSDDEVTKQHNCTAIHYTREQAIEAASNYPSCLNVAIKEITYTPGEGL